MWRVIKRLYLGDELDARSRPLLRKLGITHILNCAYGLPCFYPDDFEYLRLDMFDPDEDFAEHIPEICQFIDSGRREGKVLVHCYAGVSRSPATILAYLLYRGKGLEHGLKLLREVVGEEEDFMPPHEDFLVQLREYEAELNAERGKEPGPC